MEDLIEMDQEGLIKEQNDWQWGALTVQFVGLLFFFISLLVRRTLFIVFLKKLKAFTHDSSHTHTHTHRSIYL